MSELKHVDIYTDGACQGNPGPGGYGAILVFGDKRREISGGRRRTTNNRMEIMAAIEALKLLRYPCDVTIYSDSQYLVNAIMQGWAVRWRRNGWKRNANERAVNPDLWQELLDLLAIHQARFEWVRGHAGHPENERCDQMSVEQAARPDLPPDTGYLG